MNLRLVVLERDGWRCRFCGESERGYLRIDHIHPQAKGGGDEVENLWTLCLWCNAKKATHLLPFQLPLKGEADRSRMMHHMARLRYARTPQGRQARENTQVFWANYERHSH